MNLQKAVAKHRDLVNQLTEEKREQALMHTRCLNAESRAESLGRQVGVLVGKESELLEERKRIRKTIFCMYFGYKWTKRLKLQTRERFGSSDYGKRETIENRQIPVEA